MKVLITKALLLFITILLASCTNSRANSDLMTATLKVNSSGKNKMNSCPLNTKRNPVTFIVVALNDQGFPVDALTPTKLVKKLDLEDTNLKLVTIIEPKYVEHNGHKVKRKERICFVSAVKSSRYASGYQFSPKKIAVLWRPEQSTKASNNIVIEKVPAKSPIDIVYKFTIATVKSNPENGKTYLDPRIVIRR